MIFVRVTVSHTSGEVISVQTSNDMFQGWQGQSYMDGHECETLDLGVVEDHEWTDEDGKPCSVHRHILHRLRASGIAVADLKEKRAAPELHAEGLAGIAPLLEVRGILDAPCTPEGLRSKLRERGPDGVPVKVRAWLANIMSPEEVALLGIGRGISLSARKAAEVLRSKRDPRGGSRVMQIERLIDQAAAGRRAKAQRDRAGMQAEAADADRQLSSGRQSAMPVSPEVNALANALTRLRIVK